MATQEFLNVIENHTQAEQGFLESVGAGIATTPTAILATGLSAVNQLLKGGTGILNFLPGVTLDTKDTTYEWANKLDSLLGSGDLAGYYATHEDAINGAGFLAGSIVPGLGGLKAFKAGAGAVGGLIKGEGGVAALGRFALNPDKLLYEQGIADATALLRANPTDAFSVFKSQFLGANLKTTAGAFTSNAIDGVVFDAAASLVLNNSPHFADKSPADIAKEILQNGLLFGAVGGTIQAGYGVFRRIGNQAAAVVGAERILGAEASGILDLTASTATIGTKLVAALHGLSKPEITSIDGAAVTGFKEAQDTGKQLARDLLVKDGVQNSVNGVRLAESFAALDQEGAAGLLLGAKKFTRPSLVETGDIPSIFYEVKTGKVYETPPELGLFDLVGTGKIEITAKGINTGIEGGTVFENLVGGKVLNNPLATKAELEANQLWVKARAAASNSKTEFTSKDWQIAEEFIIAKGITGANTGGTNVFIFNKKELSSADFIAAVGEAKKASIEAALISNQGFTNLTEAQIVERFRIPKTVVDQTTPGKDWLNTTLFEQLAPEAKIIKIEYQPHTASSNFVLTGIAQVRQEAAKVFQDQSYVASKINPILSGVGKLEYNPESIAKFSSNKANLLLPQAFSFDATTNGIARLTKIGQKIKEDSLDKFVTAVGQSAAEINNLRPGSAGALELSVLDNKIRQGKGTAGISKAGDIIYIRQADETIVEYPVINSEVRAFFANYSKAISNTQPEIDRLFNTLGRELHPNSNKTPTGTIKETKTTPGIETTALYIPPLDINKYSHVAIAYAPEGALGNFKDVLVIVADSAEKLAAKVSTLKEQHAGIEVSTKQDSAAYFKAKKKYDYAESFNSARIDSTELKQGGLTGAAYGLNYKDIVENYLQFGYRQSETLARSSIEAHQSEFIAQLRAAYKRPLEEALSVFGTNSEAYEKAVRNFSHPALDAERALLDIPAKNDSIVYRVKELVDQTGTALATGLRNAYAKTKIPTVAAPELLADLKALGVPTYDKIWKDFVYTRENHSQAFTAGVARLQSIVSNTVLALDPTQWVMNHLSRPILEVAEGKLLNDYISKSTKTPVIEDNWVTANTQALGQFFAKEGIPANSSFVTSGIVPANTSWAKFLVNQNIIKSKDLALRHEIMDITASWKQGPIAPVLAKVSALGDKILEPGKISEQMSQFLVAMRVINLAEKNALPPSEILDLANTAVQRITGVYTASQRPQLFSGTTGSAIGLFQGYQLRFLQRMLDHVETGNTKGLAIIGALQTTLFGTKGIPNIDAINAHIISEVNKDKGDLYSGTYALFDSEAGQALTYGLASNLTRAGLFSRGEINYRVPSLIPLNPAEFPSVSLLNNFAKTVQGFVSNISGGTSAGDAALFALEHNALNRPLQGLAAIVSGRSTDSAGRTIAIVGDELVSVASAVRLLGTRPIGEAITRDVLFRTAQYQAGDAADRAALGKKVRISFGDSPPDEAALTERFLADYVKAGGRPEGFQRWYLKLYADATEERGALMLDKLRNSPRFESLQRQLAIQ